MNEQGYRLKRFITLVYVRQKIFAEVTGINKSQLSLIISGTRNPSSKTLLKFLQAGLDLNWYLDGRTPTERPCELYADNSIEYRAMRAKALRRANSEEGEK